MAHSRGMAGFQEVVIGVKDLDITTETFLRVGGWKIVAEEEGTPALAEFWGAPAATLRQRLIGHPGAERGYLRLVQFDGVAQKYIRDQAMAWDTGGFFDLYVPVADIENAFESLRRRGWQGFSPILEAKFLTGCMRYVITRGPEGVPLCLMQFLSPIDLSEGLDRAPFGVPFNIMMTVPEEGYAPTRAFFTDTLGWNVYFEDLRHIDPPGDNSFAIPRSVAMAHDRPLAIYINHSSDRMGSLLVMGFEGDLGHDVSSDAAPPNLGIFAVRVPVEDVSKAADSIAAKGGPILAGPIEIETAPYGRSLVCATQAPYGARIELFGPAGS